MNNSIKIAVIQFPGTNTERETFMAVRRAGMEPIEFLWNNDYAVLEKCAGYIIAGGFSYEDRSRAGIIASLDPVMKEIRKQSERGKPVLGICNGAQILVESGMVPGLKNYQLGMALTDNKRTKEGHVLGTGYYNKWARLFLSVPSHRTAFTQHLQLGRSIQIPFAHAEGRFVVHEMLLNELIVNQQTVFRYGDSDGNIIAEFPTNPNGSIYNLAAICNPQGNVMALMPHPERTTNGDAIFTSMREYIAEKIELQNQVLTYSTDEYIIKPYKSDVNSIEWFVESIITDNEALSVQNALNHLQIPVTVSKQGYWKIDLSSKSSREIENNINNSGELFNSNKERLVKFRNRPKTANYLVCPKEDLLGRHKKEILKHHFGISGLQNIQSGVLWKITVNDNRYDKTLSAALKTNIFLIHFPMTAMKYKNDYREQIRKELNNCITETDLPVGKKYRGKVRDVYDVDNKLILITSDRQSAFDRILAAIPFKGQALNLTSAWWFEQTKHIVKNHVLDLPDENVIIAEKCEVFPIEFVVRGYITGTTSTSLWTVYKNGSRNYCGIDLPEGLVKNQRLSTPLLTPTTKEKVHDRPISPDEIVSEGWMPKDDWEAASKIAQQLFVFGQKKSLENGLILVDTKYELGKDSNGNIVLVDEIHTPDSSRYWIADTYEDRFNDGQEPQNIDKEFLRLWFVDNCDPYNDEVLPNAPDDLVVELSQRYIFLYETITGNRFKFPDRTLPSHERLILNLKEYL